MAEFVNVPKWTDLIQTCSLTLRCTLIQPTAILFALSQNPPPPTTTMLLFELRLDRGGSTPNWTPFSIDVHQQG